MYKVAFNPINIHYVLFNCNLISKRLAGHSKWANIKHTKALKDGQKSIMFGKMGQQIKVAIQEGGSSNPAHNLRLEQVIAQAKRMSMPVASIENVIKSMQRDKTEMKSYLCEIRGPGNCIILCELYSGNVIRAKQTISGIMKKHQCRYTEGEGKHCFNHKGIIESNLPSTELGIENILESATNHAIECDAEDVKLVEDSKKLQFICGPYNFYQVQKSLENLNYVITNATLEYIPQIMANLSDDELDVCSNFIDKLENMDDVVRIYDNIA